AVIDAYLGAHHDVDLGDSAGVAALEHSLAQDEESVVGTAGEDPAGEDSAGEPPASPTDPKDTP
ncbi:hypothetical protein NL374_27885, partial [Klebsiella pneumoniae]|nr:hypothetical protein [Klebsiella pneumoniae]